MLINEYTLARITGKMLCSTSKSLQKPENGATLPPLFGTNSIVSQPTTAYESGMKIKEFSMYKAMYK